MTATDVALPSEQRQNQNGNTSPSQQIEQYQPDFARVLPSHIRPGTFVRLAQGAIRRNDDLAKAANKNPASLMAALLDAARLGLEPGTEEFYLVPFGGEVTGIVGYQGEIELIYRAGAVASVKAEIVYARDEFMFEPHMQAPIHRPDWFGERGEMMGVYAYAIMRDGGTSRVCVLSKADVERAKAVSRSSSNANSPWQKWPESMWRKTAIHELAKWVPTSAEYRTELRRDAVALSEARQVVDADVIDANPATGEIES